MNIPSDFKTDPKRDATDSIRGYVYQAYQSILAWMSLGESEILVLEGEEDFDIHNDSAVKTTQVKNVAANLTLRSKAVIDTLNNYWSCCENNSDYKIVLHFLTTAEPGKEKGSPFSDGEKGLLCWQKAKSDQKYIEPIRKFLLTLELNKTLKSFIKDTNSDELLEKLIRPITWNFGNKPMEALQIVIEEKLKIHGYKLGINAHYSIQSLPYLLKTITDLLSTNGIKELKFGDFLSCFDDATTLTIPRGMIESMNNENNLQQLVKNSDFPEMSRLVNLSTIVSSPIPTVNGGIARTTIVTNLTKLLDEENVIFLYGSSGIGKTNLTSLILNKISDNWGWCGFRSLQPEQIRDALLLISLGVNTDKLSPFLVLDDIDLNKIIFFEREFISLVFSIINKNGMIIVTGPISPPANLLPKLWKNETCTFSVPYFNESEVADLINVHGLTESKHVSQWAHTIWITTSGHPQLVHARVRNISAKRWPAVELSDITEPEDVELIRSEARMRLVNEISTDNTRALAYRLSIINGTFSRDTAIAVAETPPPITLPGETFDALIGPWIEHEGEDRYRVSPLLAGAANKVLSPTEINTVHGNIAQSILRNIKINQYEAGVAFFHAFMGKHSQILYKLAIGIITTERENVHFHYDAMSWFSFVCLNDGQRIFPENSSIDLLLRLAQYRLIASSSELSKAVAIIDKVEEILDEIKPLELKQYSEYSAYALILNAYDVPIPSSTVIRMLSRLIELSDVIPQIKEIDDSLKDNMADLLNANENISVYSLFYYQGARVQGIDDLQELVLSLEALPLNKRKQLLLAFDSEIDFANQLISSAWWKELDDGVLDVSKTLKVLNFTLQKSQEWKILRLTKACYVAISVIHDEYGNSLDKALAILDVADQEFQNEACLLNQRAKVLFHANRDSEALPIACKVLDSPELSDIEFVFCCRAAGISAAKLIDWQEAERLFLLGSKRALNSSIQERMGIGLLADAAFAVWKQEKYEKSLLLFADSLDLLVTIPVTDDFRVRHIHSIIRYSISWIHYESQNYHPDDQIEPFPGMCSNQEPHKDFKDQRIVDLSTVWELLAFTEQIMGLKVGIRKRAQTASGGKKPQIVESYGRAVALDLMFKNKEFKNLIPILVSMLEGLYHSKNQYDESNEWSLIDVPKLPIKYWNDPNNWDKVCFYLLKASVICIADNQTLQLLIDHWRTDLKNAGALVDYVDQFLNVLNGTHPDDTLYQQTASAVFALNCQTVTPYALWGYSFKLLNVFMHEKRHVEEALVDLLTTRWFFAINNQRFDFITPSLICPNIEMYLLDKSLEGLVKIATVLNVTIQFLNIKLSTDAKKMIVKVIEDI